MVYESWSAMITITHKSKPTMIIEKWSTKVDRQQPLKNTQRKLTSNDHQTIIDQSW